MKRSFKILSLLLCALLVFSMVGCNKDAPDDIPEGMQLATVAGDDFRLYIPTTWNPNTAYGVSGGYATLSTQSTVSMVKYPISDEMNAAGLSELTATHDDATSVGEARMEWFYQTYCRPTIESLSLGGSFSEVEPKAADLINKHNAWRFHEKGIVDGQELHFVRIITEANNAFYVFSFTVEVSLYDRLLTDVESMLDVLVFADPYAPDSYVKPLEDDKSAPEGMRLASNNEVAYRFYVPTDWTVSQDERIFAAYVNKENDFSSVSVVPYMPDTENLSVAEFFTMCQNAMLATAGEEGYELISYETNQDLGGRVATAYTYRYRVGGTDYYYLQVIAAYKSMLYSLTYTAASQELFDAHMPEVTDMIEAFTFR